MDNTEQHIKDLEDLRDQFFKDFAILRKQLLDQDEVISQLKEEIKKYQKLTDKFYDDFNNIGDS